MESGVKWSGGGRRANNAVRLYVKVDAKFVMHDSRERGRGNGTWSKGCLFSAGTMLLDLATENLVSRYGYFVKGRG
jgi:hypothetical protein